MKKVFNKIVSTILPKEERTKPICTFIEAT